MEDEIRDVVTSSRRNFTVRLIAALAAAPVIGGIVACRKDEQKNAESPAHDTSGSEPLPRRKPCAPPSIGTEPHEPPIGFYDGSLIMNVPTSCRLIPMADGSVPRPYRYRFERANYTSINEVRVMTRPSTGRPFFMRYQLPPNPSYQLRIWLVQLSASSGSEENLYEGPGAEAQLVLSSTAPHIQTQLRLVDARFSHKLAAPLRYDYPAMTRHFHIGKWQVTDSEGTVVQDVIDEQPFGDSNHDSYEIFVTFNHP